MQKKVLSEQALYYGDVDMPKGWDVDREALINDALLAKIKKQNFPFSKNWDRLNLYIKEHIGLNYEVNLVYKNNWCSYYKPEEITKPFTNVNAVDLRNSADFTCLYGVKVKDCDVTILFDDNRRKGRSWTIPLEDNKFRMFPSTNLYYITNKQKESLNFVKTITYEYI